MNSLRLHSSTTEEERRGGQFGGHRGRPRRGFFWDPAIDGVATQNDRAPNEMQVIAYVT